MSTNAIILCFLVLAVMTFNHGQPAWIFGVAVLIIIAVDLLLRRA